MEKQKGRKKSTDELPNILDSSKMNTFLDNLMKRHKKNVVFDTIMTLR